MAKAKTIQEAKAAVAAEEKAARDAYLEMIAYGERPEVEEVHRTCARLRKAWLDCEAKLKLAKGGLVRAVAKSLTTTNPKVEG